MKSLKECGIKRAISLFLGKDIDSLVEEVTVIIENKVIQN
jgi:hypothetical protein